MTPVCMQHCQVLHLSCFTPQPLTFYLPLSLSFSVCFSSVRSSQQFRDTQCCWTGQCHRGAGEEQDGEIEIINKAHKYTRMWHTSTQNNSDRFMLYKRAHTFFSGVVDREWHHGLLVICQDCDSLSQQSTLPTNGHCALANIPNAPIPTGLYTARTHTKWKIMKLPLES